MNVKQFLIDVVITTLITFVVAAAVTYLYNLLFKDGGLVDWDTAFVLAIVFGIVLPLARARNGGSV